MTGMKDRVALVTGASRGAGRGIAIELGAAGATVYTLSDKPSDPQAARVAAEENRADVIAGVNLKDEPDDVAGILLDLAQRETKTFSARFARTLTPRASRMFPIRRCGRP